MAKFRGSMYKEKCGAVIGGETRFFVCAQLQFPGYGFLTANHSAVFSLVRNKSTEFRHTTVRQSSAVVDPLDLKLELG